ncbi:MAG: hypothetical protein A2Z29_02340 [Chloroflexi bacterium RBG_16_56_11]|nr:MAG: hypothetical protein A2Z29_02340 [Chloroflexi bacterium RBG_16_56_11]
MHFKSLKGLTLHKSRGKSDAKTATDSTAAVPIEEIKEAINSRTKGLEQTAQKLNGLVSNGKGEAPPVRPHGPIEELSVTPEDKLADVPDELDAAATAAIENKPELKVVDMSKLAPDAAQPAVKQVKAETPASGASAPVAAGTPAPPAAGASAPPAAAKEAKSAADESLSNLFSSEETEVNPLANLINSLPDVTARELMDDLNEIQQIIKEWQKS